MILTKSQWSPIFRKGEYYHGTPNYVIYGTMFSLCHNHYAGIGSDDADDFTRSEMLSWIDFYKGPGIFSGAAGNWIPSRTWAIAGYSGWPSGGTPPPGDRNSCTPSCPTPFAGPPFRVHWVGGTPEWF